MCPPILPGSMDTFRKSERLANFRLRALLFDKGETFFQYPFRVTYLCVHRDFAGSVFAGKKPVPANGLFPYPVKCMIGVSKRKVAHATGRNRIRRLVKEIWRKNKSPFYAFLNERKSVCMVALNYSLNEEIEMAAMERGLQKCLQRMQDAIASEQ